MASTMDNNFEAPETSSVESAGISQTASSMLARTRRAAPAAMALVIGLAAPDGAGPPSTSWFVISSATAPSAGEMPGSTRCSGTTAPRKSVAGS